MNVSRGGVRRPARDAGFGGRLRFTLALLGFVFLFFVILYPVPYYVIAPGTAVDLTERVSVAGHAPGRDRYYLTDVSLRRASLAMLLARFVPGLRVVPERTLVPAGISAQKYDQILVGAMNSSQDIAAVVAERAAGLDVRLPLQKVSIVRVLPISRARGALLPGDVVQSADGVPIHDVPALARVLEQAPANGTVSLTVVRGRTTVRVDARTMIAGGKHKLGVQLALDQPKAKLPVAVRYSMGDVAGSSGGLMFALAIYASLHRAPGAAHGGAAAAPYQIAGTGTLELDGTVGEIEGTQQKLIAAKRAGARIFFVPRENYADIEGDPDPDVRIIPVGSFHEALVALHGAGIG